MQEFGTVSNRTYTIDASTVMENGESCLVADPQRGHHLLARLRDSPTMCRSSVLASLGALQSFSSRLESLFAHQVLW